MTRPADDYAKNQRRIRSLQPKVSSEEAHARARRALAKNAAAEATTRPEPGAAKTPGNARGRGNGSSGGPRGTGG